MDAESGELDRLVGAIRDAAPSRRPVVLLDGRSGSGKTVLAESLAPRLDAQLVSLDELYPGWEGLEAGSAGVHEIGHYYGLDDDDLQRLGWA